VRWAPGAAKLMEFPVTGAAAVSTNSPYEPWPLDERTAKVLGLPLIALTPTAQPIANGREWLWFDLAAHVAIWQGPVWQHGFP